MHTMSAYERMHAHDERLLTHERMHAHDERLLTHERMHAHDERLLTHERMHAHDERLLTHERMHAHDVLSAAATTSIAHAVVRRPSVRAGVGLVPLQQLGLPNETTLYKPAITGMQSQSQWNSQPPREELVLCYMADTHI